MKKMLFLLTFLPCMLYGQIFVDGKNLNEIPNLQYIHASYSFARVYVTYTIGKNSFGARVKNEKEEMLMFRNSVVLLNYFYQNGWEFQCMEAEDGYIFKKRKP